MLLNPPGWLVYTGQSLSITGQVHLFKVDTAAVFNRVSLENLLPAEELEKAQRFLHQQDRQRYIVRKHVLRLLLARVLGINPGQLDFQVTANKKPCVQGIEFNVSHSNNYIVILLASLPAGIDIEYINPLFQFEDLMELCFNPEEQEFIRKASNPLVNFYTLWTRKEAILKATGEGLTDDIPNVSTLEMLQSRNAQSYIVQSYKTADNYLVSTALTAPLQAVHFWEYC